jgi:hypothetical protein
MSGRDTMLSGIRQARYHVGRGYHASFMLFYAAAHPTMPPWLVLRGLGTPSARPCKIAFAAATVRVRWPSMLHTYIPAAPRAARSAQPPQPVTDRPGVRPCSHARLGSVHR